MSDWHRNVVNTQLCRVRSLNFVLLIVPTEWIYSTQFCCRQVTSVLQIVAAATVLATERFHDACHKLQVSHETHHHVFSKYADTAWLHCKQVCNRVLWDFFSVSGYKYSNQHDKQHYCEIRVLITFIYQSYSLLYPTIPYCHNITQVSK